MLEGEKGNFAAGCEGVHCFRNQKLQLTEKVRSGFFEPIGIYGNISGALKTGNIKVVDAIEILNLHLGAVSLRRRADSIDLNVGIIITGANLIPNRKNDVLLHQKYFVWMIVYTFGLE